MAEEEISLSQRIALIEQEYDTLLQKTLDDVAKLGVIRNSDERKLHIHQILDNTGEELEALRARLGKNKQALKESDGKDTVLGTLYGVPEWHETKDFYDDVLQNSLKQQILKKLSLGQTDPIVLEGPVGAAVSNNAIQLVRDPDVRTAFPEGIFWISLGQAPDILALQGELIKVLGGEFKNFVDIDESTARLQEFLSTRKCLLILDDVHEAEDVSAFNAVGEHCQWVVISATPQLFDFVKYIADKAQRLEVNALTEEAAQAYLLQCSQLEALPSEGPDIIETCAYLPTAIRLAVASAKTSSWRDVSSRLKDEDCILPEDCEDISNLLQALHICLEQLGEPAEYYLTLGVFGDYTNIPQRMVLMLWAYMFQLSASESAEMIKEFADKGLLQVSGQGDNARIQLQTYHSLYMQEYSDLDKLHMHILTAYRNQCQQGWVNGPDDGYFFRYLPMHMNEAGRQRELKPLLLDFDWIQRKMETTGLHELMYDYTLLEDDTELNTVNQTLFAIAPTVSKTPDMFAHELLNKLYQNDNKDIQALVNQAKEIAPDWTPTFVEGRELSELDKR
ncbi:MAG: NB-ARC domain-containing protein [Pseudomonadota bacterium]